jgi:5-(hydroxymethyl)furfural/furfural oxidase
MADRPDYLIVGGGSAGCVLAARLSEDPTTRVVLLEAGPDYRAADAPGSVKAISPMQVLTSSDDARFRWDDLTAHRTTEQEAIMIWRGRGIGGSSSVNGMLAVRPEPADLDQWAAEGCTGWDWESMLPWFNHIEADLDYGHEPWHGDHGPFPVWRPPLEGWSDIERAALTAVTDAGHPWCADHNAPGSTGIGPYAANVDFSINPGGERVSTNSAYLDTARDRPNLEIIADTMVEQIVVEGGRAVGVTARTNGHAVAHEADTILLCAGSPHSPALMLRSDIGGEDVGRDLGDHPGLGVQILYDPADAAPPSNGRHISCFGRYTSNMADGGPNDMAWLAGAHPDPMPDGRHASQIQVALWQPFSRGSMHIVDPDPLVHPHIDSNMLSDERDLDRLLDGFRRLMQVMAHPAVASIPGRRSYGRNAVVIDQVSDIADLDDDAVRQLLMNNIYDTQHIVGGCRMGSLDDPPSVVDPDCRVIGVDNLRIIDGSVFPTCPRANTHFTVLALAERMADRLRTA